MMLLRFGVRSGSKQTCLSFIMALAMPCMVGFLSPANAEGSAYECPDFPKPLITLDIPSRYTDSSRNSSNLDVEANGQVNEGLKPADQFARDLTRVVDKLRGRESQETDGQGYDENDLAAFHCAMNAIDDWARADAFRELVSLNAKLAYPSRIGAIAIAYAQLTKLSVPQDESRKSRIEDWLRHHGHNIVQFWTEDAPTLASKGNLRAWAALAVTQIGLLLDDEAFVQWGLESQKLILSTKESDGSLPMEMRRGKYALHYQLHAVAPVTMATALMKKQGVEFDEDYLDQVRSIAQFALRSIEDPEIVRAITNHEQTIKPGLLQQKKYVIAWIEPYLDLFGNSDLDQRIAELRPLSNSKLGGNLTELFR